MTDIKPFSIQIPPSVKDRSLRNYLYYLQDALRSLREVSINPSGSWSPVISDGSNDALMESDSDGVYVKIGSDVFIHAFVRVNSLASVSGSIRISGLPYVATKASALVVGMASSLNIPFGYSVSMLVSADHNYISPQVWDSSGGTTAMQASEWSDGGRIVISGHYRA